MSLPDLAHVLLLQFCTIIGAGLSQPVVQISGSISVSVPTGFAPVTESITEVVDQEEKSKRYEVAGRKVIFYIENMLPGDKISFSFQVKAMYPVKAEGVSSQVYSYYKPEIRGETLSQGIVVLEG